MNSQFQVMKKQKLLKQSEQSKLRSKVDTIDREKVSLLVTSETTAQSQSNQPESDSEESLSGDDRDSLVEEISEQAIQNIIIEQPRISLQSPPKGSLEVEENDPTTEIIVNNENASIDNAEIITISSVSRVEEEVIVDSPPEIPTNETMDLGQVMNISHQMVPSESNFEDKSLAALSTLRKLKSKKVQFCNSFMISGSSKVLRRKTIQDLWIQFHSLNMPQTIKL
jgi:hypothetical protein